MINRYSIVALTLTLLAGACVSESQVEQPGSPAHSLAPPRVSSNVTNSGYCIVQVPKSGEQGDAYLGKFDGKDFSVVQLLLADIYLERNADVLVEHGDVLHLLNGNSGLTYDAYRINLALTPLKAEALSTNVALGQVTPWPWILEDGSNVFQRSRERTYIFDILGDESFLVTEIPSLKNVHVEGDLHSVFEVGTDAFIVGMDLQNENEGSVLYYVDSIESLEKCLDNPNDYRVSINFD